jgi:hypothetical protein
MLFIIDSHAPAEAIKNLSSYGEVILFNTDKITYPAISNHPDIFFCQTGSGLIYAPNTPPECIARLKGKANLVKGSSLVGKEYPYSARYNAVVTTNFIIHNSKITDDVICRMGKGKRYINIAQGYCRCNLISLEGDSFITSDNGIYKKLLQENLEAIYIDPTDIILPGASYGFIGGCAGVTGNHVFFIGSLKHTSGGEKIRSFLTDKKYKITELYNGPMFDGGSIMVLEG